MDQHPAQGEEIYFQSEVLRLSEFLPKSLLKSFDLVIETPKNKKGQATTHKRDRSQGGVDQETGKRYNLPVPEHLKFYTHPNCIRQFISQIHPNMVIMVRNRSVPSGDPDAIHDIINSFVQYELEYSERAGKLRYMIYDPATWTNQPYYRWWLSQLQYFCMTHNTQQGKKKLQMSIASSGDDLMAGEVHSDYVPALAVSESPDQEIQVTQVLDFLASVSILAANERRVKGLTRLTGAEVGHDILLRRLEDESVAEIAKAYREKPSTINRWLSEVAQLLGMHTRNTSSQSSC